MTVAAMLMKEIETLPAIQNQHDTKNPSLN